MNVLFYFIAGFIHVQSNEINAATILQSYCCTHLFYFTAQETITAINKRCTKIKQNIYFIAAFILFYCT